jgi:hypothetical protein
VLSVELWPKPRPWFWPVKARLTPTVSEQRALRAVQNLDPLDVVERVDGRGQVRHVDVVHIDRSRSFLAGRAIGRRNAADHEDTAWA